MFFIKKRSIYLDHAATTKVDQEVLDAMMPFWQEEYGNPSSIHKKGRDAKKFLEEAREKIAFLMSVRSTEIYFTAGATEGIFLSLVGFTRSLKASSHFITSSIEHEAVLSCFKYIESIGHKVTYIRPDKKGVINPDVIIDCIQNDTRLISIGLVNSEIGVKQDIRGVSRLLKEINQKRDLPIFLHSDASAATTIKLNPNTLGLDMMVVNGSKIYAPKQSGFVYIRHQSKLASAMTGGGQEGGFRGGTENVAFAVGLSVAFGKIRKEQFDKTKYKNLKKYLTDKIQENFPECISLSQGDYFVSNIASFIFPGVEGEMLMLHLDNASIYVSAGSACSTKDNLPSHTLLELGFTEKEARSMIRISFGRDNSTSDIDKLISQIKKALPLIKGVRNDVYENISTNNSI